MMSQDLIHSLADAWAVLLLFLIPIGGGIPGGVLLAKSKNLPWYEMMLLYFISDVILAFAFEPITWLFLALTKKSQFVKNFVIAFKQNMKRTISHYGIHPSPLKLIMISFGVDPMTGRSVALAAGHGFLSGWAIAITGDMIFFTVIMVSTLWLNSILGDGMWATIIILLVMTMGPYLFRKMRRS